MLRSRPELVAAGRARSHLRRLQLAGVALNQVAEISGVPRSTLRRVLAGDQRRVRGDVEDRVLAVGTGVQGVPVEAVRPLLEEMAEAGFSRQWVARRLELAPDVLRLRGRHVEPSVAQRVQALACQVLGGVADPEPAEVLAPHMRAALLLGSLDLSWLDQALCSTLPPEVQELFFARSEAAQTAAVRLCGACSVRQPCLKVAVATGDGGVRGGTTEAERRRRLAGEGTAA